MLRYIPHRWAFSNPEEAEIRVYRITQEQRELLHSQIGLAENDRLIFEFIDQNPMPGAVHYYEIASINQGRMWLAAGPIRVDVYELLGLSIEEVTTADVLLDDSSSNYSTQDDYINETVYADETNIAATNFGIVAWIVAAAVVPATVLALIIIKNRKLSN